MERSLAVMAIDSLDTISQEIHRPLQPGFPELNESELHLLKVRITDVWGSLYFDLMVPVLRQYPELDPDREPRAHKERPSPIPGAPLEREECGRALVAASEISAEKLNALADVVENSATDRDERKAFQAGVGKALEAIQMVRVFAEQMANVQ